MFIEITIILQHVLTWDLQTILAEQRTTYIKRKRDTWGQLTHFNTSEENIICSTHLLIADSDVEFALSHVKFKLSHVELHFHMWKTVELLHPHVVTFIWHYIMFSRVKLHVITCCFYMLSHLIILLHVITCEMNVFFSVRDQILKYLNNNCKSDSKNVGVSALKKI